MSIPKIKILENNFSDDKREYQDRSYSNQFPNPKSSIKRIRPTIIIFPTTLSQRFSFFNKKYPKNPKTNMKIKKNNSGGKFIKTLLLKFKLILPKYKSIN